MISQETATEALKWMIVLSTLVSVMIVAMVIAASNGRPVDAGALLFGSVVSILFLFGCAYRLGERP